MNNESGIMNDELGKQKVSLGKLILIFLAVAIATFLGFFIPLLLIAVEVTFGGIPRGMYWYWFASVPILGLTSGFLSMWLIGKKLGLSDSVRISGYLGFIAGISLLSGLMLLGIID